MAHHSHAYRWIACLLLTALVATAYAGMPQTITLSEIPAKLTSDAPFALGATASSGLSVSYFIVSPTGIATVTSSTITLTGTAGAVTVKASQVGDGTYDAAPEVYRSFVVGDATQRFVKLAQGSDAWHSAGIRADGTLWAWGHNYNGQLGDGTFTDRASPVQVGSATNWSAVACGYAHTVAVRADGTLWAWGWNANSQLGDGTTTDRLSPVQVGSATTWAAVACGERYSVAVRTDGTLWAWGYNPYGQLGDGTTTTRRSPVQVGSETTWASVDCGWAHTVAVRTNGTLWAWGYSGDGQLGDGTTTARSSPVQVGSATTWASVACGSSHTVAVRLDGTLWTWGSNGNGQLGDGTTTRRFSPAQVGTGNFWASVACGIYDTAAVRLDGTLWAWGLNDFGQLGDGTMTNRSSPVQVGSEPTWASVACGRNNKMAVRTDGTLWAWGLNDFGQLGNGTPRDRPSPVQVGSEPTWASVACGTTHTAAVSLDGTLWAWGRNLYGQLGDGTTTDRSDPVQVGNGTTWAAVACGSDHTMALRTDGTLWAWGENFAGQLGDGTTTNRSTPVQVGSETTWAAVACGINHTVALRTNGTLWAWGLNGDGQLGDGTGGTTGSKRISPVQVGSETTWASVACGMSHTLALRADKTLWAWGYNVSGQLGDGTTTNRLSPVQVGSATNWKSTTGGGYHTAALRTDGTLWAWGDNSHGQFGDDTTNSQYSPVQLANSETWTSVTCYDSNTLAVRSDGTLWFRGANRVIPLQVGNATTWTSVACGAHTAGLRKDHTLWTWGSNYYGQLGIGGNALPGRTWPQRVAQTLSFPALPATLTPGQTASLTANASSGLPLNYTVIGPARLSGTTLTATGFGTVKVTAYQQGATAWLGVEPSIQTVQVVPPLPEMAVSGNGQMIANGQVAPSTVDDTDFGSVPQTSGARARVFTISNSGSAALNLTGTTKVVIMGAHAQDFQVTIQPQSSVGIGGSTQFTLTFDPSQAGLRMATVSIANDDPNRSPFTFAVQGHGEVSTQLPQAISFTPPSTIYLGQSPLALVAYASSGLPVTLSVLSGSVTISGNALILSGVGTVKLQATQAGGGNYKAALPVTCIIAVKADPATLTLINLSQAYDGTPKPVASIPAADTITYKVGGVDVPNAPTNAGSYAVKALAGATTKTGTLVIAKAPLFVTPDDQRKFVGEVNPALTFAFSGFIAGDTAADITKAPVLTTTAKTTSAGGLYPITASGATAANYSFVYQQGTLAVESFAGSYEALLVDGTPLPVGKLTLLVAASNKTFTGKLYTATETTAQALTGTLTTNALTELATGTASVTTKSGIVYAANFTLPTYGNVLATTTRNSLALGSATDGRKLQALAKGKTVLYSGAHTAVLEPALPTTSGIPAGAGWATATISTAGIITLSGELGDGTKLTSTLSPDSDSNPGYRLWVQPYLAARTQSYLAGAFTLLPHPTVANRRYLAAANMTWKKAGLPADVSYRAGFGPMTTMLMMDPWLAPAPAKAPLPAITLAQRLGLPGTSFTVDHSDTLSLTDGNLPTSVALSATNAVTVLLPVTSPVNSAKWQTTLNATAGTFTGSFELVDNTQKRTVTFTGVLRQSQTAMDKLIGDGHFLLPPLTSAPSNEKVSGEVMFKQP